MKIEYDPDADAMYIRFKKGEIDRTQKIDKNTLIDLDKEGHLLGVEFLFVKETNPELLKIQANNLLQTNFSAV